MRLAYHCADRDDARAAKRALAERYGEVGLDEAEV